jgi:hypothetical protein
MKMYAEEHVLSQLGLDFQVLDSGCCGMAGAFGFEKNHYDISIKVGERVLLPTVRSAPKDTLIIADGFSCREQIAQTTDRRAMHLAQVLQMAMREDGAGQDGKYPEANYTRSNTEKAEQSESKLLPLAILGALLVVISGILAWIFNKGNE